MESILEILLGNKKENDPAKGYLKIKNGAVVDYRFGLKKAKVFLHPVSLEGIIEIFDGEYEKKYQVKINYSPEDVFDINKYITYMEQKNLIEKIGKVMYVDKRKFQKSIFSDLSFMGSIDEMEEYFIEEVGVSPRIYKKIISKKIIEKLNEKITVAERYVHSLDKKINEINKMLQVIPADINEISEKYTGLNFKRIANMTDREAEKYISKIAMDISLTYMQIYGDNLGAKVVYKIVKTALNRARMDYYSNYLLDYIIINENYNELQSIASNTVKKELIKIHW